MMIIQAFGSILREIRVEKHISQERLAEYCDLDRTFVSMLERGVRQPTVTTIFKIAKAFDMPASELIKLTEKRVSELEKK